MSTGSSRDPSRPLAPPLPTLRPMNRTAEASAASAAPATSAGARASGIGAAAPRVRATPQHGVSPSALAPTAPRLPAATPLAPALAPTAPRLPAATPLATTAPATPLAESPLPGPTPEAIDEREHAIEAVAMLGDSVVGVKHCALPERRRVTPGLLFGIGAVALVVSAAAFAAALSVAAQNHAQRATWIGELGRPLHAFREQLLGPAYDVLALGAFLIALAAFALGLWRRDRAHPLFRIGSAPQAELPVADTSLTDFAVVALHQQRLVVRVARELGGEWLLGGRAVPLTELTSGGYARQSTHGVLELAMPRTGQLRLRCGAATVLLSAVARPAAVPGARQTTNLRPLGYLAASALAHLLLWGVARISPAEASVAGFELTQTELVATATAQTAQEDTPPEPSEGAAGEAGAGDEGAAMQLPSGQAGTPTAQASNLRSAVPRTAEQQQLARAQAIAEARQSGMLGSSALRDWNPNPLTGTADLSSGLADALASGDMFGDAVGNARGFGGGSHGFGPGGDGPGGLIGHGGRYHTIGDDGLGDGGRVGGCVVGRICGLLEKRKDFVPVTRIAPPSCVGESCGPDKEIVRRYIKRSIAKIAYCYEKELLANPALEGTVDAAFVITTNGAVMTSNASGVSSEVSQCVAGVISGISFPAMHGIIQVRYPFVFRRAS